MTNIFDSIIENTKKAKNDWINFQRKCWIFQEMSTQIWDVYTDSKGLEQGYRKEQLDTLAVYARLVCKDWLIRFVNPQQEYLHYIDFYAFDVHRLEIDLYEYDLEEESDESEEFDNEIDTTYYGFLAQLEGPDLRKRLSEIFNTTGVENASEQTLELIREVSQINLKSIAEVLNTPERIEVLEYVLKDMTSLHSEVNSHMVDLDYSFTAAAESVLGPNYDGRYEAFLYEDGLGPTKEKSLEMAQAVQTYLKIKKKRTDLEENYE
jgi:hypothetical protein